MFGIYSGDKSTPRFLGRAFNYIKKYFNPGSLEPNLSFDAATGNIIGAGIKISFSEPSPAQAAIGVQSVDTLLYKANDELEKSGLLFVLCLIVLMLLCRIS
jgi:hypothetical protein